MARTALPYEAVSPAAPSGVPPVVGSAPTMKTRKVHGAGFDIGLYFFGEKGTMWVPVQPVHAQARSVATPYTQPSTVAPDAIKPAIFVDRNSFSPVSHPQFRERFSRTLPVPAALPDIRLPGVNYASRRPTAAPFTMPYPLATQEWPTAAQWLADRVLGGQI